ncbi:MAG: transcriptional regulator [Negativicutes bacterium]
MAQKQEQKFYRVDDVAAILNVAESTAYRIMRTLNAELKRKGMIVISGRISKRYFEEKLMS